MRFWDVSALVPLLVTEPSTRRLQAKRTLSPIMHECCRACSPRVQPGGAPHPGHEAEVKRDGSYFAVDTARAVCAIRAVSASAASFFCGSPSGWIMPAVMISFAAASTGMSSSMISRRGT